MIKDNLSFINGINDRNIIETLKEEGAIFVRCPKCGSVHIVRNGHYTRKVSYIKGESTFLKIQKYLCSTCKTSFKQLPYYISTYNHYSNITLLKILISDNSVKAISNELDLSRNTIRSIRKKFDSVLKRLFVLIKKYSIHTYIELYESYFKEFNSFLFDSSTNIDTVEYAVFRLKYPCGG